jgi:hypothetical protein
MQWLPTRLQSDVDMYYQTRNATSLQTFLQRESLISSLHVSLLPPTRRKVRASRQLVNGLTVSGVDTDGEFYFRLGAWALHWFPAFMLVGTKRSNSSSK